MRNLAVNTFMSLDGVMQAPGGPEEDPTGGFTHGGWAVNYFDDEMMGQMTEAGYELLLGRGTYEIFAAHWPTTRARSQTTSTARASTSPRRRWSRWTEQLHPDHRRRRRYVAAIKRQDGPAIQVHGSPGLIQTLLEHDLIDEFRLWIFPVVIGPGSASSATARSPPDSSWSTARSRRPASRSTRTNEQASHPGSMDFDSRPRRSSSGAGSSRRTSYVAAGTTHNSGTIRAVQPTPQGGERDTADDQRQPEEDHSIGEHGGGGGGGRGAIHDQRADQAAVDAAHAAGQRQEAAELPDEVAHQEHRQVR